MNDKGETSEESQAAFSDEVICPHYPWLAIKAADKLHGRSIPAWFIRLHFSGKGGISFLFPTAASAPKDN
ncbi:hypothetical protein Y1Q_0006222 [Alligator mississippiensis]|uniref:Uncharacterized protein n=1 Tax=Alligator mississippiensis TaxID=8496 RepID=A0A151NXS5_ALLMI|nr:hypothetical protein Y1Q_0006222 [Alligator mississippiensis]